MERVDPPADILEMLRRAVRDRAAADVVHPAPPSPAAGLPPARRARPPAAPDAAEIAALRGAGDSRAQQVEARQAPDVDRDPVAERGGTAGRARPHEPGPAETGARPEPSGTPGRGEEPGPVPGAQQPECGHGTMRPASRPTPTTSHGSSQEPTARRSGPAGRRPSQPSLFDAPPVRPSSTSITPARPNASPRRETAVTDRVATPVAGREGAIAPPTAPSASSGIPPARRGAASVPSDHRPRGGSASPDLAGGHRERLRARFDHGESLPDYELLELLLFRSLPRVDTKPIAKALIREFGSFAGALAAPAHRLTAIPGVGERAASDFRLVRAAAERFTHGALAERKTLSSTDAVIDFFRTRLRTADREEFHLLFLDKKNQVLAAERAAVGTVDHTPVYPREVMRRALELSATAIVLVHNHPSGDPTPSRADVAMTQKIIEAGAPLGVTVHDHLIVGANRCLSLRAEGLI